ncbi:hemagglutinin repeat-containing protein [Fusobacterium animalis]|uniref:hemagglutinin repeat-containing protein n=1 Tax=Fusobacterium animalis TaxID=76859 RepID=UPI0030D4C8E0
MNGRLKKLVAIFMLFLHIISLADGIVPDNAASKNLQVDKAANGVPLVNIEAPDNNGTSHNVYKDYNVDSRGAILNNAKDLTNSQLGGLIYGNPNLQKSNEASTIINEVSGVNRSRIEGYQEIAGKRANYILANPNGIYINGAGFINTGNVTFTTGRGNNLLNPEKGMIEVAGKGLDLRNINKAELIARVAELSAPIYGGEEVNLKLGSQEKSNKPEYALDARALGSIYAGRINIIVNEDGVGVKTQAPMYATKGDVVISSKGKVYLKDTEAKGDIKISSTETEIDNKLLAENKINIENKKLLNKGQIIANKDVTIKGNVENNKLIFTNNNLYIEGNLKNTADIQTKNNIEINGKNTENTGLIVADKKININSDNINNTNKLVAKDTLDINNKILTNSGKIYSGNKTKIVNQKINNLGDITSSGEIDINSTDIESNNILANGDISINTKELKSKGKIYSDKNISLTSNNIENNELTAKNLKIVTDKLNNNTKIATTANMDITAKNLVNKGMIYSTGKNDLKVTDLRNNGNILSVGNINISQNKNLINSGKIQSNNDITINSEDIENNELIGNKINITTNSLKNNSKIVAKADNSITAKDLVNIGNLYSTGKNDLKVTDLRNSGNILSVGNINISQNKNLINSGKIQSNEDMVINSKDIKNNKEFIAKNLNIEAGKLENTDKLIATNDMVVNSGILNNSSLVQALKMTLIGDTITNNGNVLGVNDITIKNKNLKNDGSLVNNGRIQAKNILELNIKDIENNNIIFSKDSNINSQSLKNKNEIVSTGKAVINSDSLENDNTKGVIFSKDELNITSNKINLTTNIGAGKLLKLTTNKLERPDSYITGSDLDITINGDYINNKELIGKNLKLTANNLENNSIMASAGKTELKGNNSFKNNANSLLYGRELVKLEGRNFTNKGEVSSFGDLNMNFTGDITNLKTIEAAGNGEITANNYINKGYLTGNHSYKEVSGAESNIDVSKLPPEIKQRVEEQLQEEWNKSSRHHKEWDGESYLDGAKIGVSNYKSNKAYLKTEGNLIFNITNKLLNQEADILAGKNITINAVELNNTREGKEVDIELYFKRDYTYKKRHRIDGSRSSADFSTDIPYKQTLFSDKPTQIIAGGNIIINAEKVGNGEYQTHKSGYTNDIKKVEKASNIKDIDINKNIDTETTSNVGKDGPSKIDDTFEITNNSIVKKIKEDSAVGVEDYIEIPKNDNGMFIINKKRDNPKFSYLIETNPKMIDKGFYLSSDYFFKRIKFNPDRDIRLLGDSFYENRLITRAVLEGTGKRFLYSNNVNEERKKLFDNAIAAQKDLNLSLGIALSKEQINNLKSDILWYVEEVVNGEKVLVPKLYLSKNTLKSIAEEQGNIIKAGGNFVINNASIVDNSGKIIAKSNVLVNSKKIYQNAAYSDTGIYATNIGLVAKEDIENIGGNIVADNNVSIYSENGDIKNSKKLSIHENDYHNVFTDVRGSGDIVGNKISIVANNVENLGADIKARDKIQIGARKNLVIGNLEAVDKKVKNGGKDFVLDEKKTNVGSNLKAKDISLTSLGNIGIIGSNVVADNKMNIGAKGDIAIVAGKDSTLHEEKHNKSKGFGRSESSTDIAYATHNVASNVIGDKVNITSEKNISLLGSNVQANTEGQIKADGNITQAGVKDTNYSYHKTTKTGFMGLTSKSVTDENYAEKAILSATLAGNVGLTYDSKNNLILSGVKVVSSGSVDLKGKNVEINPLETKSYNKHEEVKKGFSGSFSPKGISVSYGKDKFSSDTDIVNQTASQIVSNKDINIEATGKVKAKSVDIYAKNDVNISGDNGVEISTANNSYDNTTKQSSSRIGASVGINSAIVNTVENVRDIKKLTDFSGNSYDILNNASKVVGAIKDGAKATIAVADTNYNGATDAGYNNLKIMNDVFKANISYNKSKSKSSVHNETVEKSSLVSERNMNIKSKNGNISISGTDVKVGNDLDLSAKKDITIKASEENYTSSNSSSQMGIGLSADLSKGKIADLSISKAGTKGRGNGTNYINSTVNVGGKLKTNSENLTLSGANVEADKLDIKAKNLVIESKQDKSERKDSSYGGSFSIDLANPSSFSANINGSKGSGEKEWINKQTSLITRNGGKVNTDSLTNIGAVIGSENEKEKLKVSANKVVVKDLEDKNKYENIGGGITIGTDVPNTSIKHDKINKEQIDRATAINADFEISGKSTSGEDLGFNTDIDKSQEKTKDEEKHLDAELHTDLLGKDKQEELKKAGGIISDLTTALGNKSKTEGDFLERYKQLSMMRAIGDQVAKNPEYLSILEKEAIKNGKIDDKTQVEQVSVMNKLLNDALRAKGYKGPDIKMVLTDVNDPNGLYYTDPVTNVIVFDRKKLASANRDEILNALGHEFGHYSKEDNKTGTQTIANYSGEKLEDRTKGMVAKEATEDTLAAIRNNKNVITGEEGKKLAESIPMDRREYHTLEWCVTGSVANEKVIRGIRASFTNSIYQSFDLKNDRAVKYTAITTSIGGGNSDVSVGIGLGLYSSDSPEEISKLTISHGGSIEILKTVSIGMDFLSENKEGQNFLQKLSNVKGVRLYIGKSIPISSDSLLEKFLPAKLEKHISVLDIGNINIIKDRTILDYWEDESIPSGARAYYQYYYKK